MATIGAKLVKQLRDMTGAGMMDCKKALVETEGDIDKAVEYLQIKGISKAAKKAGRVAAEGLVNAWTSEDGKSAALVEINSETDFVARNDGFIELVAKVTNLIGPSSANTVEEAMQLEIDGMTLELFMKEAISTIGENLNLRRFVRFNNDAGLVTSYMHAGSQIGVLVSITSEEGATDRTTAFGRDVAMHAAAMGPAFLSPDEIDADTAAKQEKLFTEIVIEEGKPEKIIPRIVDGKMAKWRRECTLLNQPFVKNPDLTIQQYQDETGGVQLVKFLRFKVGEGIEKVETSLADEVAAMNA